MNDEQMALFDLDTRPVIKGFPELRWTGKRPYKQTQYFPAQLKETYGNPVEIDGGGGYGLIRYIGAIISKSCLIF